MAPTHVMERNARRVVALRVTARRGGEVGRELDPIIAELRDEIAPTLPKRLAARLLGVSVPTLNKWIARGMIPVSHEGRYDRVARDPLLDLAEQVEQLRRAGRNEAVIAHAVDRLQASDPEYNAQITDLYGESLTAMRDGDLVDAEIPDAFGDDD